MAFLTAADLQSFSDLALDLFMTDTASIMRHTRVPDSSGGDTSTTGTPVATSPCAVLDLLRLPQERVVGDQLAGKVLKHILFPRGADVQTDDRVIVANVTYFVIDPVGPSTFEAVRLALVSRDPIITQET